MHIEHIAVWTRDLERLREFYETFFQAKAGAKYSNPQQGFESYFLTFEGDTRLELMQLPGLSQSQNDPLHQVTGYTHLAVALGSEERVDAMTETLQAAGCPVLSTPRRTGDGYYESVVLDPDGNLLELTV